MSLYLAYCSGNKSMPPRTLPGGASVPAGAYSKPTISTAYLLGAALFFSKTSFPIPGNYVLCLGGLCPVVKFSQTLASGPTTCSPPPFPSRTPLCPGAAASTRPAGPSFVPAMPCALPCSPDGLPVGLGKTVAPRAVAPVTPKDVVLAAFHTLSQVGWLEIVPLPAIWPAALGTAPYRCITQPGAKILHLALHVKT